MRQSSFAEAGFERYSKRTRRERFLEEMDRVVPWEALEALIEPCYPSKRRGAGRPAVGLDRMLRIHFLQHWFNLSDPAVEEALYDSKAMRRFVGIDLGREPAPDETTICKFRHLLEANGLGEAIFQKVGEHLKGRGLRVSGGTIVDATLINAPSSTKNREKKRDPEMRQTRKGNQWYFGMKAHIGVDARTKLIHSVATTPANVHDSQVLTELLHGEEREVWGDSAYQGQGKVIRKVAPQAREFIQEKAVRRRPLSEAQRARNRIQSRIRAKVEHPFHIMKRVFGFTHVRYRGLAKNTHRVQVTCALVNLFLVRKQLLKPALATE